jgi:hypothetical protein
LPYKEQLLKNFSDHEEFLNKIYEAFPKKILNLKQSDESKNAAEILAFSKIVNRFIKNELKVVLSTSVDSLSVDKYIHSEFRKQKIRDLNKSWTLRPQTKKASNKIASFSTYTNMFKDLDEANKTNIISRMFPILCNRNTTSIGIKMISILTNLHSYYLFRRWKEIKAHYLLY